MINPTEISTIDEVITYETSISEEAFKRQDLVEYEYHKLIATLLRELKDSKEKEEDDLK